jgi:hypothetical protein
VTQQALGRRTVLIGGAVLALSAIPAAAQDARPAIHVLTDPNCGCCTAWIDIIDRDGFAITTERSFGTLLMRYKMDNGIPQEMISCHTDQIDGYVIEGHVPLADIRRLLAERSDAVGLAVPGMPFGAPGMGPEDQREAYDVFLIRRDGTTDVFSSYEAA